VIENPQLRAIFMLLRQELKDSDIPHRTHIRDRIMKMWDSHLEQLQSDMEVAFSFFIIIYALINA
jgi:hypothetical protein